MTTKELINAISKETGMRADDVTKLMDTTSQVMQDQLLHDMSIHIQNFGVIEVKQTKERVIVHPKTGERQTVAPKKQVSFKQNPVLKENLNRK